MQAHRRHDISDRIWENIQAHLPGSKGLVGRPANDNRLFINAVFWILGTGAPWRELPPDYGDWKNTHRRFCRWRDRGVWEHLLEVVIVEPDFEWLMVDASHCKVHPLHLVMDCNNLTTQFNGQTGGLNFMRLPCTMSGHALTETRTKHIKTHLVRP